jgi:hypothetical protein
MTMDTGDEVPARQRLLPVWIAAAVLVVAITVVAVAILPRIGAASPTTAPTPAPSLPGAPGHFADGQFAFDYPTDWGVISGNDHGATGVLDVIAVLGNGTWQESCRHGADGTMSWMSCGTDAVGVPPGGIVVRIYLWYGGPAVPCRGDTQANATLGTTAVRATVDRSTTSWEIRAPGNEFGQPNNVFVEAHTSDPTELARAEDLATSFRWLDSSYSGGCSGPASS